MKCIFSNHLNKLICFIISLVVLTSLACNFPVIVNQKTSQSALPVIPVSTEAMGAFQDTLNRVEVEIQNTGKFSFNFTETEINSYIYYQLQNQQESVIKNPQIYLRDGLIIIFVDYQQSGITFPIRAEIFPIADGMGGFSYEIVSSKMGIFPIPGIILGRLQAQINRMLNETINNYLEGFYIENINIDEGIMSINGYRQE